LRAPGPGDKGSNVIVVGVLVSGSGTNLQAIIDRIAAGRLDCRIGVVVSNRPGVRALERAAAAGVPTRVVDHRSFKQREEFDAALADALREAGVELVVLAGFDRLITRVLLGAFPDRVINIHPALLPAFKGLHAQRDALEYGVKLAGATVHLVRNGVANVGRGLAGPSLRQRLAELSQRRSEDRHGQGNGLAGQHRHAPRELRGQVFGRQRQPRQAAGFQRRGEVRDEAEEPPLQVERRGEVRAGGQHAAPALFGQIGLILARNRRNQDVRHGRAVQYTNGPSCYNGRMINVSETAASKINELLTEENKAGSGLRVFVQGGGCSGFQYGLMIEENGQGSGDQVFESHGVKLFIDPISIRYLNGAEVDFVDTITGGGFTIKNPNATSTCGCGSSFSVE